MSGVRRLFSKHWLVSSVGFMLLAVPARNLGRPQKKSAERPMAAKNSPNPEIDLNCITEWMQNPPGAFHYSADTQAPFIDYSEEADVTPQSMSVGWKSNGHSHTYQAQRSDAHGWAMAWSNLNRGEVMGMDVEFIEGGSAKVREGTEKMNGYDTIKYSIDSARGTTPEDMYYRKQLLGPGGFEKGTVWLTPQGCPVKFELDGETHTNGRAGKIHYYEAIVKK